MLNILAIGLHKLKHNKIMAKVAPFHSVKPNTSNVYHDNSSCTEGNNIETVNKKAGTDGRPKCAHCAKLN